MPLFPATARDGKELRGLTVLEAPAKMSLAALTPPLRILLRLAEGLLERDKIREGENKNLTWPSCIPSQAKVPENGNAPRALRTHPYFVCFGLAGKLLPFGTNDFLHRVVDEQSEINQKRKSSTNIKPGLGKLVG
ncbi:uncharacterized protein PgNI_02296 [Pyricularia grisea]|uniref:Uncharacterized protein n=1 Tax=Pyricularia grisea TaxID=148305 RepID=A0A6P8BKC0_PYRGI|nr:uncharacterized protein PgNI_02296 [Pyricularia grisea]TLD17022.1 hypothetical protein PgNI_02296 [Pyricularia grisea]